MSKQNRTSEASLTLTDNLKETRLLHPYFGDFVLDVIADIYIHEQSIWTAFVQHVHTNNIEEKDTSARIAERVQACLKLMSVKAFTNVWHNYKTHEAVYQFLISDASLGLDAKWLMTLNLGSSEEAVEDLLFYLVDRGYVPLEMKMLAVTYACLADMQEIAKESKSNKVFSYEEWLKKSNLGQFSLDADALSYEDDDHSHLALESGLLNHNGTFKDKKLLNDMMELAYLFHDQPKRFYLR